MFKNYLTVAIRTLLRKKLYAFINIFGLALGLACCLLMALFVKHEWSYDRFHENKDQIYRLVAREVKPNGDVRVGTVHPLSMVAPLAEAFPRIVRTSGFIRSRARISNGECAFRGDFGEVSADFLKMFRFPLLAGDAGTVLAQPDAVVISEPMAQNFFGTLQPDYRNVLGKTLTFNGSEDEVFVITGILQAVPENSSLRFDFLIPISHHKNYWKLVDDDAFTSVFVQFAEGQDAAALEAALPAFVEAQMGDRIQGFKNRSMIRNTSDGYTLRLQPLTEVYWNPLTHNSYEERGNPFAAYLLAGRSICRFWMKTSIVNTATNNAGRPC